MHIVKKESYRSPGTLLNKTDDMYRVTLYMKQTEYKQFAKFVESQTLNVQQLIDLERWAQKHKGEIPSFLPVSDMHFIERCKFCQSVINQCQCAGPKEVRWGVCSRCAAAREMAVNTTASCRKGEKINEC